MIGMVSMNFCGSVQMSHEHFRRPKSGMLVSYNALDGFHFGTETLVYLKLRFDGLA